MLFHAPFKTQSKAFVYTNGVCHSSPALWYGGGHPILSKKRKKLMFGETKILYLYNGLEQKEGRSYEDVF
jgi:hypothetical protein